MQAYYFHGGINIETLKREQQERAEKAAAEAAERETARAEQRTVLISEIVEQAVQNSAQDTDGGECVFTKEQVSQMMQECLERSRALDKPTEEDQRAAKLAYDEMMLAFRADLVDHGLPAKEIIDTFTGFDFTTPEGLRFAVDDVIELYEIIAEYASQYEATIAAKSSIPERNPDVIRKIFEVGGHA